MVVIFPKFTRPLDQTQMLVETCSTDTTSGMTIADYSSKILLIFLLYCKISHLVPLYVMALLMVLVTLFYISFFKCQYRRRRQH